MAKTQKKINFKKPIIVLWAVFFIGIFSLMLFFYGVSKGLLGKMPSFAEIENPNSELATEIFSADSDIPIGKFFSKNRSNAQAHELPQNLIDALVATEDVRFYQHSGIDLKRSISAIVFLGKRGGGSTITQQLAKNLFHDIPQSKLGRIGQKINP